MMHWNINQFGTKDQIKTILRAQVNVSITFDVYESFLGFLAPYPDTAMLQFTTYGDADHSGVRDVNLVVFRQ